MKPAELAAANTAMHNYLRLVAQRDALAQPGGIHVVFEGTYQDSDAEIAFEARRAALDVLDKRLLAQRIALREGYGVEA